MKRIAILLASHDHGSGAERVLEYLLAGASEDCRGEISLIAPESSSVARFARALGYRWIPWRAERDSMRENGRAFLQLISSESKGLFEVVHAWHTRHLEWAFLLAKRWGTASAGTIHDDPSPSHDQFGALRKRIIRFSAQALDGCAAVSEAVHARCEELGWNQLPTVIPNGLPDLPPNPSPSANSAGRVRIGFLAATVTWKGAPLLPGLIDALAELPVEWNLFGTPLPEIRDDLVAALRHAHVRHHGTVPLTEALAKTDVILHLSTAFDPYPTVLLEAARAGLPCVATTLGGAPEIVAHEETGLLIPPQDIPSAAHALARLVGDPSLRDFLGRNARERYERNFRVERMVADYHAFWKSLRPRNPPR